jgi:hypothetical protein
MVQLSILRANERWLATARCFARRSPENAAHRRSAMRVIAALPVTASTRHVRLLEALLCN